MTSGIKCTGCSAIINAGDVAVFAERAGAEYCWHPQCFKCCVDDAVLVDLIYFKNDEKLYCARHWSEQFKPRCHGCEEVGACVFECMFYL